MAARRYWSDTVADDDAVRAAHINRRCKADAEFRRVYGRFIRNQVDERTFEDALTMSLDREKREAR